MLPIAIKAIRKDAKNSECPDLLRFPFPGAGGSEPGAVERGNIVMAYDPVRCPECLGVAEVVNEIETPS
jgi:hypothetical protein